MNVRTVNYNVIYNSIFFYLPYRCITILDVIIADTISREYGRNIFVLQIITCARYFVSKNYVLHARITDDTHERLTEKYSELGYCLTNYVTRILDESFDEEPVQIEPIVEDVKPMPKTEGIIKN